MWGVGKKKTSQEKSQFWLGNKSQGLRSHGLRITGNKVAWNKDYMKKLRGKSSYDSNERIQANSFKIKIAQ